ncbi:MAG: nitroreductase family deazaflavin-dependent oxidoreductase [Actinobacteria bacterium]|nr:nitroreductase family deazaflavin-dependent oxidoreductase [Actinomycetota bacterium]
MSPFDAPYEPSPWEPIAEEVELYERTAGAEPSAVVGDDWIILWTVGARSGTVRKTPLVRIADDAGCYAVIGSMGGAPNNPQWVHNLRALPLARLQDGAEVREFDVLEVEGDARSEWWTRANQVWPEYDTYQASTERHIPVFELAPRAVTP